MHKAYEMIRRKLACRGLFCKLCIRHSAETKKYNVFLSLWPNSSLYRYISPAAWCVSENHFPGTFSGPFAKKKSELSSTLLSKTSLSYDIITHKPRKIKVFRNIAENLLKTGLITMQIMHLYPRLNPCRIPSSSFQPVQRHFLLLIHNFRLRTLFEQIRMFQTVIFLKFHSPHADGTFFLL